MDIEKPTRRRLTVRLSLANHAHLRERAFYHGCDLNCELNRILDASRALNTDSKNGLLALAGAVTFLLDTNPTPTASRTTQSVRRV